MFASRHISLLPSFEPRRDHCCIETALKMKAGRHKQHDLSVMGGNPMESKEIAKWQRKTEKWVFIGHTCNFINISYFSIVYQDTRLIVSTSVFITEDCVVTILVNPARRVSVCVCVCVYTYSVCVYIYIYIYIYMCVCVCVHIRK